MDITLAVSHVPVDSLKESADALSHYRTAQGFRDIVQSLVDKGVTLINPPPRPFHLSDDL